MRFAPDLSRFSRSQIWVIEKKTVRKETGNSFDLLEKGFLDKERTVLIDSS